ncbi:MAG: hypothetical protein LAP85_19715 [Acidobacteriia bacterium]|nr:hypothetical protein [Terriglobia bacterium]
MARQEVGQLCCRVLGIYTFIHGVSATSGTFLSLSMIRQGSTFAHILGLLPAFILLSFSAYLWLYAGAIASRMFSEPESTESLSGSTTQVIQRVAFSVAGILILNSAMPTLGQTIVNLLTQTRQAAPYVAVYGVESAIRVVVGIWLLLGSASLRKLFKKDW